MTGGGVVEPYRHGYRKQNISNERSTGTNLWAVKPVRKSVTLSLWGMYAAGKKEKGNEPRGGRHVGCKARMGSTTGDPWGQVQSSKKNGVKRERPGGWGAREGSMVWNLKDSQQEVDGLQRTT